MVDNGFDVTNIEGFSIPDVWFQCVRAVLATGREYVVGPGGSFEGEMRKEFDFAVIKITNPGHRPLHIDIPAHLNLPAINTKDSVEKYFREYLMNPAKAKDEDYTYGNELVGIVDQVTEAINKHVQAIRAHARTNQATMQVGRPQHIQCGSPPCLRLVDTSIVDGSLWFQVYFRSWDLWAGFPTNMAGLQLMKEFMASAIGVKDGGFIAASKGLHLYRHCWDIAETGVYKERIARIDSGIQEEAI